MKKTVFAAAITAALLASPAYAKMHNGKAAACAPVTTAGVEAQFTKFNNAWATKNPDTVTALFAKEPVLLATVSNKPRTNAAEVRDYFVSFLKNNPVGTIDTSTIWTGCNVATRLGTWTVTFTDAAGAKTDVKARYSFIYKYENGQWKIAHLHSSMMPEKIG